MYSNYYGLKNPRIKNVLILCIAILWSLQLTAQHRDQAKLIGFVRDSNGKAIANATVYIPNTAYSTEVDKEGHYILVVGSGEYEIISSAVGYIAEKKKVSLGKGENKHQQFILKIDPSTTIDQVVVDGKSAIQEVRETPFNVVALDAKSQYNSTLDLAHLLDRASGVKIRETGGVGSDMSITINGFTGRNIRVFMDGVPMQGFGSAFQLNNIPVNVADRIEIYKGVVPIEFGADALGGVINIVTNQTANTTVDASYSYGSFNTHKTNLSFNHTFNSGISLQLTAFQNYSDNNYKVKTGYFYYPEASTDDDGWGGGTPTVKDAIRVREPKIWSERFHDKYRNETLIAQLGIVGKSWADRMLFGITLGQVHKDVQNGADMAFAYGERTAYSKSVLPSFTYNKRDLLVKGLSVRINGNYNYQESGSVDTTYNRYNWAGQVVEGLKRGEAGNNVLSNYSTSNSSATANIGYRISQSHSVSFNDIISGYERKPDLSEIELPTAADSMTRTSLKNTMGLEYRYTFKRKWNTNIFAKHYLNKGTGPQEEESVVTRREEKNSKIGYGIATTYFFKDVQIKASAEKAYRLPTDQELFGDELLEVGNLTLKPEESNNYNIGLTLNKEFNSVYTLYVDWSGYYRNTYDFIQKSLSTFSTKEGQATAFVNSNHGRVTNLGTDIEARLYYKNKATIGTTVTYMNIRDKEPYANPGVSTNPNLSYGERMPNQPYFFGNADASYYLHNLFGDGNTLNLNYTFNFVEKMYLNAPNLGYLDSKDVIPRQMYSDFSATYMLKNGKYNISFEARNLENAFLYDNFSLQKPGRSFAVKLRYYFIKRKNNSK
ncbi:TonB-dependent receptor [Sphingobacterium sp. LRF_L2]|uniref:TonB-dependent receptor n=1 Tax=Sphingobacterium sp. LRF_L2 TaxID=3369421 RepID=UPI003F64342A